MSMSARFVGAFASALALSVAAAEIPLPEHPRPDWERADWVNLNGDWDFGFAADRLDRKILVPFGWGSPLSGVKSEAGQDTGHYRRQVTVPAAPGRGSASSSSWGRPTMTRPARSTGKRSARTSAATCRSSSS